MPTGVYRRTRRILKALSEARLGISPWNKGIKINREKYPNMGHFSAHSELTRAKMKENHRGMTGKKQSKETIKKISKAQAGKPRPRGSKSNNWKGGQRRYLTSEILKRDNYTCKICGLMDEEIVEVDHIMEKSIGGLNQMENLQTLCPNCHRRKTVRFMRLNVSRLRGKLPFAGK